MANICCDDVIFYTEGNPKGLYDLWEDLETYIILNQNPDLCWIGNLFSHKKIDSTGISLRGNISYMEWNDTYILLSLSTAWSPLYEAYQAIAASYHLSFVITLFFLSVEMSLSIFSLVIPISSNLFVKSLFINLFLLILLIVSRNL